MKRNVSSKFDSRQDLNRRHDTSKGGGMLQIRNFLADEDGATALEYGLLAALIAAAIVAATTNLGVSVRQTFDYISDAMQAVLAAGGGGSGS